jgi:uracil phosphoribosyltransferase
MGNVSQLVPSIHAMVAIAPPEVMIHSPQFVTAAASETAIRGLIDGAKALAMTVVDLIANAKTADKIKMEFQQGK